MPVSQDQNQDSTWSHELQQDPLSSGGAGDDDFTKFLELGNDFTHFDSLDQPNVSSGLDTPMSRLGFSHPGQMQMLATADMEMLQNMPGAHVQPYPTMQHGQTQYQQYHQMYQQMSHAFHQQVPPTPVSAEMHGAKYGTSIDKQNQIMFDRQQASFTPLVSPAQTPLENAWGVPDYVVADEFFSPLTSPAIEAQQNYASASTTASPVDLNSDPTAHENSAIASKKGRKKLNPSSRAAAAARSLKQSPAMRPATRRRQASQNSPPAQRPGMTAARSHPGSRLLPGSSSQAVSSEDSVSPEPLSEALMRPPPVPQGKSPTGILRLRSESGNAPATPAMLMKIPGNQTKVDPPIDGAKTPSLPEVMEDIALPDAAAELPARVLPEINTNVSHDDDQSTPTLSAKTPKLSADSTPRSTGMKASNASQENLSKPSRGGRTNKKRQSVSSAAISPALRPKISPSISPLAPNTGKCCI